jgi:beta-galactosidase
MLYGLTGEIVKQGKVILEACNTDWSRWNGRPEYQKTAAVYRSEREAKPEGPALVKTPSGKGQVYLTSIDLKQLKSEGETLLRTMLSNLGLTFRDIPFNTRRAFASDGALERALFLNGKNVDENKLLSMENRQFVTDYESGNIEPAQADMQGFLNLSALPGVRQDDRTVFISFWIFSPRSLVNLLVEPDMPKLNLTVEGQTGVNAYINGSAMVMNRRKLENMPLEKGWNHILLKFEREERSRNWRIKVQFDSDNPSFFQQVKSSVAMP